MRDIKKFKGFEKHLRYFVALSGTMFLFAGLAHLCILINKKSIIVAGMLIPNYVSYLVIFISAAMVVMATYYLRALKSDT